MTITKVTLEILGVEVISSDNLIALILGLFLIFFVHDFVLLIVAMEDC